MKDGPAGPILASPMPTDGKGNRQPAQYLSY
jgi:hypothetical protein